VLVALGLLTHDVHRRFGEHRGRGFVGHEVEGVLPGLLRAIAQGLALDRAHCVADGGRGLREELEERVGCHPRSTVTTAL